MIGKALRRGIFGFSSAYLKRLEMLYKQQKYNEILGLDQNLTVDPIELKKKYIYLVKQYHVDNCQDESKAAEYEEITKIIIASYNKLNKYNTLKDPIDDAIDENIISQELFGKPYKEVKYWMHQPGNQKARQEFVNRLMSKKGKQGSRNTSGFYYNPNQSTYSAAQDLSKAKKTNYITLAGIGAVFCMLATGFYYLELRQKKLNQASTDPNSEKYKEEHIDRIFEESLRVKNEKAGVVIADLLKDQPPALILPKQDPHLMKQLTQYSIAPDIHLFEVPSACFYEKKQEICKKGIDPEMLTPLDVIKPNTVLTLSLQAERALHNIYVKTKDVIKEIEKTGKFVPPKVFFRFHGYIMFELREMPMLLKNYRDTDYISLFDLYFQYYSSIFLRRDEFCEYLVGKDDLNYFGWVHLNKRYCEPVYLPSGCKVAYFVSEKEPIAGYESIWAHYYKNNMEKFNPARSAKEKAGL